MTADESRLFIIVMQLLLCFFVIMQLISVLKGYCYIRRICKFIRILVAINQTRYGTVMESESDFDASSGDEWEETSESSSSDEEVVPVPARRYAASTEDVPAEAAASTGGMFGASSPRRSRGRRRRRVWSRGRPRSRDSSHSESRESSPPHSPGTQPSTSSSTTVLQPLPLIWSEDPNEVPDPPTFTGIPRINVSCINNITPMNVLSEFFTEEFFENMKTQTNLYASQKLASSQQSDTATRNILKIWKPVTVPELKIFLGIMLHTGIVKKPQLRQYWSNNISYRESFCPSFMSRDRFTSIFSAICTLMTTHHTSRFTFKDTIHCTDFGQL
ncbi:uncharacterized protein LOC144427387 [Styela clava]